MKKIDPREQVLRQRLADARRVRDVAILSSPDWRGRDDAQFEVQEAKSALRRYLAEREAKRDAAEEEEREQRWLEIFDADAPEFLQEWRDREVIGAW